MKLKCSAEHPSSAVRIVVLAHDDKRNRLLRTDTQTISGIEKYVQVKIHLRCILNRMKSWIHLDIANEASYCLIFKLLKVLLELLLERDGRLASSLDSDSDSYFE